MPAQAKHIITAFFLSLFLVAGYKLVRYSFQHFSTTNTEAWCATVTATPPEPVSSSAVQGKVLFQKNCASCHTIYKEGTGPALIGFEERHKWADRKELYKWINNPQRYMQNDLYTQGLRKKYGSVMTAFPDLTNEEIDAICDYID